MDESLFAKLLRIRKKIKKKKPKFTRQEGYRYVRLKDAWRKPRGRHSKLRRSRRSRGEKPSTGFRSPPLVRGLTRQGYIPVLVANKNDLVKIDPKKQVAVIRSSVGRKKRMGIISEAEKMNIKVLNAYKYKLAGTK